MDKRETWTREQEKLLIYFWNKNYTKQDIANKLDRSYDSINRKTRDLRRDKAIEKRSNDNFGWLHNEAAEIKPYTDWFRIKSKNVMIIADTHLPFMNVPFAEKMFFMRDVFGSNDLIIAGDFFDEVMFSFFDIRDKTTWQKEKEFASVFINQLLEVFDNIYILMGNHDLRILRLLKFKENFEGLIRSITQDKRVKISDYPKAEINKDWEVYHPRSYSQISGQVAKKLAEKYGKNVIATHGHFTSYSFDRSGKYECIDIGGLVDYDKIEYVAHSITTHPRWINSFMILRDNKPYIFTEKTDWDFWGKTH